MHRGVREFVRWIDAHRDGAGVDVNAPAGSADVVALEHQLGVPLPADLRFVLTRFNGGVIPSGELLPAAVGPGSIEAELRSLADAFETDFLDPELLLPFHRTTEGSLLCFDRSAGPVSDTWPVVDFYEETHEVRIVYRTFDGWCRNCISEWNAPDFEEEFSLDKYLRQGKRHVDIEPDISTAHATVAHALRRAGRPEAAMGAYLRAARCVPPLPWCDWEALKLAVLLGRPNEAIEAAQRLSARAPSDRWRVRETTPGRVADVIARLVAARADNKAWARILDALVEQATDEEDHAQAHAVRRALLHDEPTPAPRHFREASILELHPDPQLQWDQARQAYIDGTLRDDDMLLDPSLSALFRDHAPRELLEIRRDF